MNDFEIFLARLRYRPALRALIPLDACMGIPLRLNSRLLYIPFFQPVGGNQCVMKCEFLIEYPTSEIYTYRKTLGERPIQFDAGELRERRDTLAENCARNWRELPAAFSEIYRRAMEAGI